MAENNYLSMDVSLKDVYKDAFLLGAACEHVNERNKNNEIGNPDKEALIKKHFDSITFANELKPLYNMGFASEKATEEYLPFVINPAAKKLLDWAKENGLKVRGHVMVWHSQCAKEAFCKNYEPVTFPTDPEILKERPMMKHFEKLNPVCFVSRETMLKRLQSYIYSLLEYMYENGYADMVYAWDVVNEAIELEDKTETGLRNSYWYQVIGDDFIYWSFKFAHDAVEELSVKYESRYGIVKPALFYNDYNEMDPDKKAAIIGALTREGHGHGSIVGEKLIDGIGMQGHISDNNDIDSIITALKDYAKYANQIHITELDVKCTCTNINAEYYQAVFYKNLFEALLKAKEEGANLTCVTLWGLTDDNSWIRGADPLLFKGDLSEKKSFEALVYAKNGGDLGEPEPVCFDLSDRYIGFNFDTDELPKPEDIGFKMIGFGQLEIQDRIVHSGKYALANEKRFGSWSFIGINISDFVGQTIDVDLWVKSPAKAVSLKSDASGRDGAIFTADTSDGEWKNIKVRYKVPGDVHSMFLRFETIEEIPDVFSPVYLDDISIKLVGLEESFEEEKHIAAIRGAGHLPFIYTTADESHTENGKSLCVTRHEKDATVKFDISSYIGHNIKAKLYVKTTDEEIRIGLDAPSPVEWGRFVSSKVGWTEIEVGASISENLTSAQFYVETEGSSDMFIDDILVTLAD